MEPKTRGVERRQFLKTAGVGAAVAVLPARMGAAAQTPAETANIEIVNGMCAAWVAPLDVDRVASFLADDCVFRATQDAVPVSGRSAIVEYLQQSVANATAAQFEVVETFARGPIVVNERFDRFTLPSGQVAWHGVGVFHVTGGKIVEWSDFTIDLSS